MRISELSPEFRPSSPASLNILLNDLESCVKEVERLSPDDLSPQKLSRNLKKTLSRLNGLLPLPESGKIHIWKLSYRLWNACVDVSNAVDAAQSGNCKIEDFSQKTEEVTKLRQISADLLFLAGNAAGIPSPALKNASFYYRTGLIWHDLKKFDLAAQCYERATDLTAKVEIESVSSPEEKKFLLDLSLARSRTAWESSERNLALTLLNRSKTYLFGSSESCKTLAEQYLQYGKFVLSKEDRTAINEALKLINESLDLCEKGLQFAIRSDEALVLKELRSKSLRFLAAAHLQAEEFESVLKCVRVLRETFEKMTCSEHPSVGFMAMKAWLGMGRHAEAEKELRGMVVNKGVPEAVCVSAIEIFVQGTGAAMSETSKSVFLELLGKCHLSAGAAVRLVQKLAAGGAGGGDMSQMRVKVVTELVSDERVVALFAGSGDAAEKERQAMHAVLWNSGAEHFKLKDYEASAEMFEKSMLFLPHIAENRLLRAKSYRVLCICHLGLSQLDRAEEYINEAEKLDPNIACAFLKFKIYLQKKDEQGAIYQIQMMINCVDFNPDFLTLSAHEAIAFRAHTIALTSLSNLLNLYSPGKPMPMSEAAVLRFIIVLLLENPDNDAEILKFTKRAWNRLLENGAELFFGKGVVGLRELNWFGGSSWNMGIKTAKEKRYDISSEFWELASQFYNAMGEGEAQVNRATICKSLILSVAAMIAGEKQRNANITEADVKKALETVDRARKILTSISTGDQLTEEASTIEPNFLFLYTLVTYDLHTRLNAKSDQLLLIKSFASSKACTPQYLLQMGLAALQGPRSNLEAAEFAFNACLAALLAAPSPDYQTIAFVIRKLILLAGLIRGEMDEEGYGLYKEAYRIMVGLKGGEYPAEEGKWLATTAWNRSVLRGRVGQIDAAKRWMKMGLDLARQVPGAEGYRCNMERCLAGVEKVSGEE